MLPVPKRNLHKVISEGDANWDVGILDLILKPEAMTNLRREVRREQKEKRDRIFPWISLFIGLLGTATAFLAVLLNFL